MGWMSSMDYGYGSYRKDDTEFQPTDPYLEKKGNQLQKAKYRANSEMSVNHLFH